MKAEETDSDHSDPNAMNIDGSDVYANALDSDKSTRKSRQCPVAHRKVKTIKTVSSSQSDYLNLLTSRVSFRNHCLSTARTRRDRLLRRRMQDGYWLTLIQNRMGLLRGITTATPGIIRVVHQPTSIPPIRLTNQTQSE